MNRILASSVFLISVLSANACFAGDRRALPGWMAGCWEQRSEDFLYQEQWMSPLSGTMLGMARMVAGNKLLEFEFLRIVGANAEWQMQYIAMPSGQAATAFTLTSAGERQLVFENRAHDFPQRIVYSREDDILAVDVEGETDGQKGFRLEMKQVECPQPG